MKINTLVIDDNPHWRKTISKFVEINPLLNLVGVCESAMEAYGKLAEEEIDLLICDIEMPEVSGLSFAKAIQGGPLIIFVTSHQQYAFDCYEVTPVDFLLKPLDAERFLKSIEKARKLLNGGISSTQIAPYFFIRESHSYVQIFYHDVLYVQSNEHFLNIVTPAKTYVPLLPISKFEENIKNDVFIRIHRSYIVNRNAISQISKNEVELTNGEVLPIGEQYRSQLKRKHITGTLMTRTG